MKQALRFNAMTIKEYRAKRLAQILEFTAGLESNVVHMEVFKRGRRLHRR